MTLAILAELGHLGVPRDTLAKPDWQAATKYFHGFKSDEAILVAWTGPYVARSWDGAGGDRPMNWPDHQQPPSAFPGPRYDREYARGVQHEIIEARNLPKWLACPEVHALITLNLDRLAERVKAKLAEATAEG
ncbi:MAG: hypothetical protein IT548_09225 [Alphaproteobacteria bacterium]|nr:hypothetical protein [Alphaproteobacteria bacterium]